MFIKVKQEMSLIMEGSLIIKKKQKIVERK
jgi:hypothetical protein